MNQIEGFANDAGQLTEAILKNNVNGEEVEVTATTNHPDSGYGQAVRADGKGTAYCQAGMEAPFYTAIKKQGHENERIYTWNGERGSKGPDS